MVFFGALGVVVAYLDLLTGSVPFLFGLSLIISHFYYADREVRARCYAWNAVLHGAAIAACFIAGYVVLTLLRFGLLTVAGIGPGDFLPALLFRFGSTTYNGTMVTLGGVADELWRARSQLTPGGAGPATWVLFACLTSWIFSALASPVVLCGGRDREGTAKLAVDILVLVAAAAGVIAWYILLPGHTYTHALFAVRTIALPAGCGVAVALIAAQRLVNGALTKPLLPVIALSSVALAAVSIGRKWTEGEPVTVTMATFVASSTIDQVSCQPLGLYPDGRPDGVVELRYREPQAPAVSLGLMRGAPTAIRLVRNNPMGVYETGPTNFVLGISRTLDGRPLNQPDGTLGQLGGQMQHLYAHFCRDGQDTPRSEYRIDINGTAVIVTQPQGGIR